MADADGVLCTAPVHGFGTGALMQAFIERSGVGYLEGWALSGRLLDADPETEPHILRGIE